jgi:superoxide dismutase, Cu-Zn family
MRVHRMIRPVTPHLLLGLAIVLGVGLPDVAHGQAARAQLKDAKGKVVGSATLGEASDGVRITVQVSGFKPGEHGFHIHTVGKCEPPEFASAGAHFNPYGKKHGLDNPSGPHAGDFPNLKVEADGTGSLSTTDMLATLKEGPNSLFQPGGTSLIVHADPDDEKTDPTGNSGARVACGVIEH